MSARYAELHCASHFSFLRGASSAEELFSQAAMENPSPFTVGGRDVMVMLNLDENGKVTDFEVLQAELTSVEEVRDIGNLVMFSTFTPATRFGQRVSSKRLFAIRHISVTG